MVAVSAEVAQNCRSVARPRPPAAASGPSIATRAPPLHQLAFLNDALFLPAAPPPMASVTASPPQKAGGRDDPPADAPDGARNGGGEDGETTPSALEATAAALAGGRKPLSRYELCRRLLLDERDDVMRRKPEDIDAAIAQLQQGER
jgi:hypothetical protein